MAENEQHLSIPCVGFENSHDWCPLVVVSKKMPLQNATAFMEEGQNRFWRSITKTPSMVLLMKVKSLTMNANR